MSEPHEGSTNHASEIQRLREWILALARPRSTPDPGLLRHALDALSRLERDLARPLPIARTSGAADASLVDAVFDNHPFSMSIATASEGRFLRVNDAFLQRTEYTREEVIGRTSLELGLFESPKGRDWLLEPLRAQGKADALEFVVRTKSGNLRHARLYARLARVDGELCIVSVVENLDELTEAEKEATRTRLFYEELLRDLPAQIALIDSRCRYLYLSPSSVGDPELRQWLIGKTDYDYCKRRGRDTSMADQRAEWIRQAFATGEMGRHEERFVTSSGEVRYFIRIYSPVKEPSGKVTHLIAYGLEITDFKELEEQFRQAQKMEAIGRLAGGVAHDFNNQLTAIMGTAELLLNQVSGSAPLESRLAQIQRAANRAAMLTRQLMAFSRRRHDLHPELLDLNRELHDIEDMLRRLIGEKISLALDLAPGGACVEMDRSQFEQIILNLVVNARDAMPDGGAITLKTALMRVRPNRPPFGPKSSSGAFVVLSVTDTGVGMDEETKAHIFEPFFTTKDEGKGTGLGLSTVYAIVERYGGLITVDSGKGEGTTFRIFLPRAATATSILAEERAPDDPRAPQGHETVLVVEDEEFVRNVVRDILERRGYRVLAAASGNEALEIADAHPDAIHLVLSDMIMPGMSGRELCGRLCALRPGLRLLIMSGHSEDLDADFLNEIGPRHYLQKPFTAKDLAAKVREVLDSPPITAPGR